MSNATVSLTINDQGKQVAELQKNLGKLGYDSPRNEIVAQLFGVGTQDVLRQFQKKHKLRLTGILDARTHAALMRAVAVAESGKNRIEERIYFDDGSPATAVKLRFHRCSFGGSETMIGETETDGQGFFAFSYDPTAK